MFIGYAVTTPMTRSILAGLIESNKIQEDHSVKIDSYSNLYFLDS